MLCTLNSDDLDNLWWNYSKCDYDGKKRNLVGRCYRGKKRARQSCRGTPFIKLHQIIFSIFTFHKASSDHIFNVQFLCLCIMRIIKRWQYHSKPSWACCSCGNGRRSGKIWSSSESKNVIFVSIIIFYSKKNGKVSYLRK